MTAPPSNDQLAAEAEHVVAEAAEDVRRHLAERPRADVIRLSSYALETLIDRGQLAVHQIATAHAAALVLLAETEDDLSDEEQNAGRYRLAWQSALRRAQDLRIHAAYVETERDALRQAVSDWICGTGDARVVVVRDERDAALREAYLLRAERDDLRHELETLRDLHKDLDQRYVLALDDQSLATRDRDAAAAELETLRGIHQERDALQVQLEAVRRRAKTIKNLTDLTEEPS